jgi:hypothetical protein
VATLTGNFIPAACRISGSPYSGTTTCLTGILRSYLLDGFEDVVDMLYFSVDLSDRCS